MIDPFAGFLDEEPAVVTPPAPLRPVPPVPDSNALESHVGVIPPPQGVVIGSEEARRIIRAGKARLAKAEADEAADAADIPAPQVRATPIELDDERVPRGCRTIAKVAGKAGFDLTLHYARGPWMHSSQWTVLRIAESIVLRMRHPDGRRAVAQWLTQTDPLEWKLEAAHTLTPLTAVKSAELKTYLLGPDPDATPVAKVDLTEHDTAAVGC